MWLTIIFISIVVVGFVLYVFGKFFQYRRDPHDLEFAFKVLGLCIAFIGIICSLVHFFSWTSSDNEYEYALVERQAIERTLEQTRKYGNENELNSVTLKVIEYNIDLAIKQYENTKWYQDCYIDDRFMDLKPIE